MKKDWCSFKRYSQRAAYSFLIAGALASCMRAEFNNQQIGEDLVSYEKEYSNYSNVNLTIAAAYPGIYSVYFEEPYDALNSLSATPYASVKAPAALSINVPNGVKKLYVVGADGAVFVEDVKSNIAISVSGSATFSKSKAATRSDEGFTKAELAEIRSIIDTKYFPEKTYNFRKEELYRCTDLTVDDFSASGEFDEADVWITYLGDGGFGPDQTGKLWFYTYDGEFFKGEDLEYLDYTDCTFYGMEESGEIVEIKAEDFYIKNGNYQISTNLASEKNKYLFANSIENPKVKNGEYTKIHLGKFPKGTNIGFVFRGKDERCTFTTPALNLSWGDYTYVGKTMTYNKGGAYFTFKPTQRVANGFICSIVEGKYNVKVLGMENRCLANTSAYDGDYNDMLCLIETNPIIKTVDEAIPERVEEFTVEKGVYLFEDNYPTVGDHDFNDVVVEYEIKKFVNGSADRGREIINRLLAYGCVYTNEFGYRVNGEYTPVFKGIRGYKNVREGDVYSEFNLKVDTIVDLPSEGEIRPYLYNGSNYIVDANYNTGVYPYVLIIPATDNADKLFEWCKEGKAITDAYDFASPRAHDWYLNPKNEELVFKRSAESDK